MKAVVVKQPGGPEVLELTDWPLPEPEPGWVRIRIRAFGLNRAEMFTRQGHSPGVTFPRILGIECAGEVDAAPGGELVPGQKVITAMGGLGRQLDGGYAEYTCVPVGNVVAVATELDWATLGAIPEMLQTAWGSLERGLGVQAGHRLLVRGGTSSVGLAAIALAHRRGATVIATTRDPARATLLSRYGADHVVIDQGAIAESIRAQFPGGVERVLELVGATTLLDSLRAAAPQGVVCMTGIVGGAWTLDRFEPMVDIPDSVRLTAYSGTVDDLRQTPFDELLAAIAASELQLPIARVLSLADVAEAHQEMERSTAGGKMVVVLG